jgi:hypothetical protein
MHYTIDENTFAVNIYDDINPEPFWYQPDYPNTDKFDSYEEAETWAKLAIKSLDPEYGFNVPNGKGLDGTPKPTPKDVALLNLSRIGLTVDELKLLLESNDEVE